MVSKRPLARTVTLENVSKRVKKVERQVKAAYEMKTATASLSGATATGTWGLIRPCRVAQGADINERIGNKIRVHRIEVRGTLDFRIDIYILQKKIATDPVLADLTTVTGAYFDDNKNGSSYVEWAHHGSQMDGAGGQGRLKLSRKFPGGMVVHFSGPAGADIVDNELQIGVLNLSGTTLGYALSCRVWYTDV